MNDNFRLNAFIGDDGTDITEVEELEKKIAPDDQQTAGFLD